MSKKILDFIISISLIGIVIFLAKDYFFDKKYTSSNIAGVSPTVDLTPSPQIALDPEVNCENKYFNFKKGSRFRYKLAASTEINKQKQSVDTFFTNTIVSSSGPAVTMETVVDGSKEKSTTIITCKRSGIYGFPFPKNTAIPLELPDFLDINKNLLLLPPEDKLFNQGSWTTQLGLNLDIPFFSSIGITLENTVAKQSTSVISGTGSKKTLIIQSHIADKQPFLPIPNLSLPKGTIIEYTLAEGVGLTEFSLNVDVSQLGKITSKIQLLSFIEGDK